MFCGQINNISVLTQVHIYNLQIWIKQETCIISGRKVLHILPLFVQISIQPGLWMCQAMLCGLRWSAVGHIHSFAQSGKHTSKKKKKHTNYFAKQIMAVLVKFEALLRVTWTCHMFIHIWPISEILYKKITLNIQTSNSLRPLDLYLVCRINPGSHSYLEQAICHLIICNCQSIFTNQ